MANCGATDGIKGQKRPHTYLLYTSVTFGIQLYYSTALVWSGLIRSLLNFHFAFCLRIQVLPSPPKHVISYNSTYSGHRRRNRRARNTHHNSPLVGAISSFFKEVRLLTSNPSSEVAQFFASKGATTIRVDYSDEQSILSAIHGTDVVINALGGSVKGLPAKNALMQTAIKDGGVKLYFPSEYGIGMSLAKNVNDARSSIE